MSKKDLEKELKKSKLRTSIYRKEVLEDRRKINSLIDQYEAVVKDWKKIANDLLDNAPKLFLIYLHRKWQRFRGKEAK